jgi:hypothetical protein
MGKSPSGAFFVLFFILIWAACLRARQADFRNINQFQQFLIQFLVQIAT